MRIAILTNGLFPFTVGGIQMHSYQLSRAFARLKISVDIYYFRPEFSEQNFLYNDQELEYIRLIEFVYPSSFKFPGHYILTQYYLSREYFRYIEQHELDYSIIYSQGFTSLYFLNKRIYCEKLVTNLHGLNPLQRSFGLKNKLQSYMLRIPLKHIIKNSKTNISLGGKLTSLLIEHGALNDNIIIMPNGIDPKFLSELDIPIGFNHKLRLIFIGRYDRVKGLEELNQVLKEYVGSFDFEFHFVGPIPDLKKVISEKVIYHGLIKNQDTLKSMLENSDVLVCPSHSEGMPTVILEAMACKCSIITTDVGANNTMVFPKRNGWLISGDIIDGLKLSFKELFAMSKVELDKFKIESYDIVSDKYTWDIIAKEFLEKIKRI